jgi:NAD(P)-dependent dehydrogenase (short-subunit alcohol dehydrogenase family)
VSAPIVVVTGGNRGIGFEISRQLAARGAEVVLTARNDDAGKAATTKLAAQNLTVQFHSLDVTSLQNIDALRDFLKRTYGRLDVLINNAGIIDKNDTHDGPRDARNQCARAFSSVASSGAATSKEQAPPHREFIERHGRLLRNGRRLRRLSSLQDGLECYYRNARGRTARQNRRERGLSRMGQD